ncbi:MAG: mechanosensitive ion channel family protein [Bacilli bacterium]|nr:mechanosensitive ion channel family protein [Bacilli bacterium]
MEEYLMFLYEFMKDNHLYGVCLVIVINYLLYVIVLKIVKNIVIKGKTPLEIKRRKTIQVLFQNVILYVCIILALLFILDLYGVNTRSLLTSLGVAGVILGLALQDTVKDIISGIAIISDNYFVVGDFVTYDGFTGEVIDLSLRTTKIKGFNGDVKVVANRNISSVINESQKMASLFIDIPTAYEEKSDKIEKVLNEVIEKVKTLDGVNEDSKYLGISAFDKSSVSYTIKVVCRQGKKYEIKRSTLKIIKDCYDKNNIKIPYEQIEVHNGKNI